jgi:hypothetical protein
MQILRTAAFGCAAVLGAALCVQAQTYSGAPADPRLHGYEHGYRDGYQQGRLDHGRNMPANPRIPEASVVSRQYEPYMGSREDFVIGYGDGYRTGYDDAYNGRRSGWEKTYRLDQSYDPDRPYTANSADRVYEENHWSYQDVAYDIGYRDGLAMGQADASRHKDYRPEKNDRYDDADHGYHSSYGPKDNYKNRYREAFLRGYSDGYGRWQ